MKENILQINNETEEQVVSRFEKLGKLGILSSIDPPRISFEFMYKTTIHSKEVQADDEKSRVVGSLLEAITEYFIPENMSEALKYINCIILTHGSTKLFDPQNYNKDWDGFLNLIKGVKNNEY